MNNMLRAAADRAGVEHFKAESLIRELRNPTTGMVNDGDVGIPPFCWSETEAPSYRKLFPGWEGLTAGEFYMTRSAVIWRAICDGLLDDRHVYCWEDEIWPHPKGVIIKEKASP